MREVTGMLANRSRPDVPQLGSVMRVVTRDGGGVHLPPGAPSRILPMQASIRTATIG